MNVAVAIGKYTLESLTTGMYSSPMDFYREYIQNSVDSIDQAIQEEIIKKDDVKINISIDTNQRSIVIEDNGTGILSNNVIKKLTDIGNSNKLFSSNRGFRGIGRLAGLSYCNKLSFITSAKNETIKTILCFDCQKLKTLLIPGNNSDYDLSKVLQEVIKVETSSEKAADHYFRVVLEDVNDTLGILELQEVKNYLVQVAPLPFDSEKFKWGDEVKKKIALEGYSIGEYNIYLNGENLFKANSDFFIADKVKKNHDKIKDIKIEEIKDEQNHIQAIMWYSITNMFGAILNENFKGIRVRKGNILIGDRNSLNYIFKEERFNGWFQGEIHIIDENIIPNARRDGFEQNENFILLEKSLREIGEQLSKEIRNISYQRNNKNNKLFVNAEEVIEKADKLLADGFNSQKEKDNITHEVFELKQQVENLRPNNELSITRKSEIFKQLDILANNIKGATKFKILNLSQKLTVDQKKLLEKVFDTVTEACPKKQADFLISEIMKKF